MPQSGCQLRPRLERSAGPASFWADPLAAWPRLTEESSPLSFSSFDRTGGNADGFDGNYSALYQGRNSEEVLVDAPGPGVLDTLWFTGPDEGGAGLALGTLRFYFDDERQPRLVLRGSQLFGGHHPAFPAPLVADNQTSTGGFVSWVPLPFARRLVLSASRRPGFYAAHLRRFTQGRNVRSWRPNNDLRGQRCYFGQRGRAPRSTCSATSPARSPGVLRGVPLRYRYAGTGAITRLRFSPAGSPSAAALMKARLRIFWDGASEPAIDAPLGMFFGSGLGEAALSALAFEMRVGGPYDNYLVMPFWRGFRLELVGLAGRLELAIAPNPYPRGSAGHLWALYRHEVTRPAEDFLWVDLPGARGKLVGTVLTIMPRDRWSKRWWEGDLRSYVDGRRTPAIHGTGVEDDHLGGWSNTFFSRPFSLTMHGEPRVEMLEEQELQHNAAVTLYRLWPGISFRRGLRHGLEHGSENGVSGGHYHGLAFVYRDTAAAPMPEVDGLLVADAAARQAHHFDAGPSARAWQLTSSFEGEGYAEALRDTVVEHGTARFLLSFPAGTGGCLLRWRFDAAEAPLRAAVRMDGVYIGTLSAPGKNNSSRWAERDLLIPAGAAVGRTKALFEIVPEGTFNAAEYRLYCRKR